MRLVMLVVSALLLSAPALAGQGRAGGIVVEDAWARASAGPARAGAAYLTLRNAGSEPDRLLGVESPAAERAAVHTHEAEGNVVRMRAVDAVELSPGSSVEFRPGGMHVMLIGLKRPLKEGDTVPVTLRFEKAGSLDLAVEVRGVAAHGRHRH